MVAALWFVVLAVAATAPALFGSRSLGPEFMLDSDPLYAQGDAPSAPPVFDPTRYYYDLPRDFAASDGIRHGRIDLWNPRIGVGRPLWGEGGALFFIAKIPFYLAPSRRTYDLVMALRLIIAGVGAFLLARWRGLDWVPALASGALFELSGSIMSTLQLGVMAPPCLLPWVLLGAEAIAQRKSLAAAAGAGLALAVAASSGHPMLVVVVFAGYGAAVVGHMLAAWRQPRTALAIGGLAIVAFGLGMAVAAPAVLPVMEAQRVGRLYKETPMYRIYLRWFRVQTAAALPIAWFAPATLGALRQKLYVGFPYVVLTPVVGVFGLVLAIAGLLRRGLDAALIAVGLVGVGLTLAPPVLGLVTRLPLLEYVYPMYGWSLVTLPLTQAAGRGVTLFSTRGNRWVLLAALAVVLAGAWSLLHVWDAFPGTFFEFPVRKAFLASLDDSVGWLQLLMPLVLMPLAVVALVAALRTRFAVYCAIAASGLATLELLVSVAPVTWFPDSAVLGSAPSPAVRFLQEHLGAGDYRMLGSPRWLGNPGTPSLVGLADVRGASALPVERYVRYLEAISPNAPWYVWQFPGDVLRHPLLDLASVRYVVQARTPGSEPEALLQGDPAVRLVYRDERVGIYENRAALPRARVVHGALLVQDQEEAFQHLHEAAAQASHAVPAGLADRVVIEPSADWDAAPETAAAPAPDAETVRILPNDDPDQVELQATLSLPGWVVLADTFYPGWTATIDGVTAPIHPADLLFRAVFVPPGTHRVAFRYQPLAFRLGVVLAMIGLAMSAFLIARGFGWPKRRRSTAAGPRGRPPVPLSPRHVRDETDPRQPGVRG
jgi:hypothetical protein